MAATVEWRDHLRGFCVIELEHTLLEVPSLGPLAERFGLHASIAWARSLSRGQGSADEARRLVQAFAGIPVETAKRTASDMRFRQGAAEAVVAARDAGLAVVLLAPSPRPIAQQLAMRLGVEAVAGWEPEIAYGRFTGRMDALPWHGECGNAVCGRRLVEEMRRRHGRPAVALSAVPDKCLFQASDTAFAIGHEHPFATTVASLKDLPQALDAHIVQA